MSVCKTGTEVLRKGAGAEVTLPEVGMIGQKPLNLQPPRASISTVLSEDAFDFNRGRRSLGVIEMRVQDRLKNSSPISKIAIALILVVALSTIAGMAGYWKVGTGDNILFPDNTTFLDSANKTVRIEEVQDLSNNTAINTTNRSLEGGSWWMDIASGVVKEVDLGFDTANQTELDLHTGNTSNPHSVTYGQTGALQDTADVVTNYYLNANFAGLNDTQGTPSDGEGWCWNATSGYFEPCSVGGDGYLPTDPPTTDTDFNNTNVTGVRRFESKESVSSQVQINTTIFDSSGNPFMSTNGTVHKDMNFTDHNTSDVRLTNTTGSNARLGMYVNDSGYVCYDENCNHYTYVNDTGVRIDE